MIFIAHMFIALFPQNVYKDYMSDTKQGVLGIRPCIQSTLFAAKTQWGRRGGRQKVKGPHKAPHKAPLTGFWLIADNWSPSYCPISLNFAFIYSN